MPLLAELYQQTTTTELIAAKSKLLFIYNQSRTIVHIER